MPNILAIPESALDPAMSGGTGITLGCTPATYFISASGLYYRQNHSDNQESVGQIKNGKIKWNLNEIHHVAIEKLWSLESPVYPVTRCSPKNKAAYQGPIACLDPWTEDKHRYHGDR
jgi:hypothetical protein